MHLKDYLNFIIRTKEYKTKVAATNGNVAELCSQFVEEKFNKFNNAEKKHIEQEK